MRAITEALKQNPAVIHIVDGPRGPKGVVKPGLISMAQISGVVILPVIGLILDELHARVLEDPELNHPEVLIGLARELIEMGGLDALGPPVDLDEGGR